MGSTVANISAALGYDVAETMLSQGMSLASVLAFVAVASDVVVASDDSSASSSAQTVAPSTRKVA